MKGDTVLANDSFMAMSSCMDSGLTSSFEAICSSPHVRFAAASPQSSGREQDSAMPWDVTAADARSRPNNVTGGVVDHKESVISEAKVRAGIAPRARVPYRSAVAIIDDEIPI